MSDDVMPCEHGSYGLCPQCVREERDRLRAELAGKEKALSAAKTVIEAKDKAYALIDQRFAAMAAKAATTDSERECNERLTAEIDALTAKLAEARRLLDEASKQEPVAWGITDKNKAVSLTFSKGFADHWKEDYPTLKVYDFYAASVPAQPAVPDDVASKQEPVAWMLEWTYDGDEPGRRLYDDERHCLLDANRDGGVCRPLYAAPVPPAAVPDDVAKDAAEVVAYRIHYPGGAKRLTEDGDVYEHEKRAGLKIDWLGVVGGIDAAILSATEGRSNG